MDNWFMCTAPVFVKRPVYARRGNFRTEGFGSRESRAVCGLGGVQDYPSRPYHLKKWRHFRPFVNRHSLSPHDSRREQRLQRNRSDRRCRTSAGGERPLLGSHSGTVTGWIWPVPGDRVTYASSRVGAAGAATTSVRGKTRAESSLFLGK